MVGMAAGEIVPISLHGMLIQVVLDFLVPCFLQKSLQDARYAQKQ